MELTRKITGWVNQKYKSISACEAEIREELEFHLEMRSLENQTSGMTVEEARRDAQIRFGNFEKQYEACRQASLGWQLVVRRMQVALFVGLTIAVLYLAWALVQAQVVQTEYKTQLESLRTQLQVSQQSSAHDENRIPYVKWEPVLPIQSFDRTQNASGSATSIEFVPGTLDEPWSQWSALSETVFPISESP